MVPSSLITFGMAGAHENPAGPGDQREDVTWGNDGVGPVRRIDRNRDGAGAVGGADPGGDPLDRLDRYSEGGLVAAAIGAGHRFEPQLLGTLLGQREADQAATMPGHEVDRIRSRHLRRDHQVALVLTALVVDEDEHPAIACLVDDRLGTDQHFGGSALDQLLEAAERVGSWIPFRRSKFPQAVRVEPGGARQSGAADLSSSDDRFDPLDQGGAHSGDISHCSVMKRRNSCVPTVIVLQASGRCSERARPPRH
jgi:hypothetical protein